MSVLTISRQLGSLDLEIAQELARTQHLALIDKEEIEKKLQAYKVEKKNIERFDERKPGFWDAFSADRDIYLHYLKLAILEYARQDNCIILGRGAQVILENVPGVLRLRFVSAPEIRVQRLQQELNCNENHAYKLMMKSDHERAGFHRFFFDVDWTRDELYDIVLNTGTLPKETILDILTRFMEERSEKRRAERKEKLDDLILSQQVVVKILYEAKLPVRFLEVRCTGGSVVLEGVTESHSVVSAAETIAKEVRGVKSVENRLSVVVHIGS
jgi:cytidylate kinase